MAVTAIDAVIAHMMFMAEGYRLIKRKTHVGGIGRPINRRSSPAGSANQNDYADDDHAGVNIRAGREKLGHES